MFYTNQIVLILLCVLLVACSTTANHIIDLQDLSSSPFDAQADTTAIFAQDDNFVVLISQPGETLQTLAEKYLGDVAKAWIIADFNDINQILPNREIVIPLKAQNPTGVYSRGYQTIPILCYHRFGQGHEKMAISASNFRQQMQFLKDNHFNVIAMKDIYDFVNGMNSLPKKSVIITIDDGYRSTYEVAYPILAEFGFHATVFLYTDFVGSADALSWQQAIEMSKSGLIDFQPHSKSHPNMTLPQIGESDANYKTRILTEIDNPSNKIQKYIKNPMHTFAYPYGDTNEMIVEQLKQKNYRLGVTVQPGGNASFAHPYMLHRTMIFGDQSIDDFAKALVTFKRVDLN